jgi:hypothetical protein
VTIPIEFLLIMGYAICLALISMVLEMTARFAQRRSMNFSTTGFVYHPERDIWRCPHDQHLFPIFSDSSQKHTVYRAPASACNSCPSKAACTDSSHGREIKRVKEVGLDFGMGRFHRAISITLLTLASVLILVDFAFGQTFWQRTALTTVLFGFGLTIRKISREIAS